MRAVYEWTTSTDIVNPTTVANMASLFSSTGITDVFLYLEDADYTTYAANIPSFIAAMTAVNVNVWGLDGSREFFDDWLGPSTLFGSVQNMIAYNSTAPTGQKFVGFITDMEPQDGQGQGGSIGNGYACFHNGKYDAQLSILPGSGVWKSTQQQDRIAIVQSWLSIQSRVRAMCNANGLRFGGFMVSWTESYFDAPVVVEWHGVTRTAGQHMMSFMGPQDVYGVGSYSTTPSLAEAKLNVQLAYAQTLPSAIRPIITMGVETNPNNGGSTLSYGSDSAKNHHASVLADYATVLAAYPALGGLTINDFFGWNLMPA